MTTLRLLSVTFLVYITTILLCGSEADNNVPSFRITSILLEPWFMPQESRTSSGRGPYRGFAVDLVEELARVIYFNYTFVPVKDARYGTRNEDGTWTGMIGEVARGEADIAVAPLTITFDRSRVVDFTQPFHMTGISAVIAYADRLHSAKDYFALLFKPFSASVWLLIIMCFLVFGLGLFLLRRYSPHEKTSGDGESTNSHWLRDIGKAYWFAISTFTWQGYEKRPRAVSARILSAFWFSFVLVTLVMYTAAMFRLTSHNQRMGTVRAYTVEDLISSHKYKFVVPAGGSTQTFFKHTKIAIYEQAQENMDHAETMKEGFQRALDGDLFFAEASMADWAISGGYSIPCNKLVRIGRPITSTGYGIALQQGSPHSDVFSNAILMLRETGIIEMLYNKWFTHKSHCGPKVGGGRSRPARTSESMDAFDFSGVVFLLVVGILLSAAAFGLEVFLSGREKKKEARSVGVEDNEPGVPPEDPVSVGKSTV